MKLFKNYILKHMKALVIPIATMIIALTIDSTFPYLQKIFVDDIMLNNKWEYIGKFFFIFICLTLARSIIGYIKEYLFDKFALNVAKEMREDLFDKIQCFEFSFFDNTNTGELMSRIAEDVDTVWETLGFGMRLLIEGIILFMISTVIMFKLNPFLTGISLLVLLPVGFLGVIFDKKFCDIYSKISDQTAQINSMAQQDISGIRLVKAFAREKHEISKFLNVNKQYYNLNIAQATLLSKFIPTVDFLTNLAPITIIIFGGLLTINGSISFGTILAFSSYILNISFCVRNFGWLVNLLSQNKASLDKIFKILERQPEIKSSENAYKPENVLGNIEFEKVNFKYKDEEILKNINLNIPRGSTVAIMGATGCGKSSLISLIGRYYDVFDGEIKVDGVNVKEWDLEKLRESMSVVFQDTFLFSDTIKNNIDFGGNHSEEDVVKSSKDSCAYEFISELSEGYNTEVGERGVGLSGGQKQRLAIARGIIRKSSILILDDATSALDMETERNVLKNLSKMENRPTTFIIAHRISGVKDADIIIFMKDGEIVEIGNHESLLKKQGYYYNIYRHQFKDFELIQEVS
ncbi:ABC transporter ATP-binding protein [Clostridium sp. ATCC 25772]|uniref:ABC transporter ATP-binding protein n=1 Tax=Clostridium sp. ATCC 25772 TaxID=1676991 RepID=UPI00078613BE|nr:ABC transporter ATP-binding protein [Clostridium sp. ATCC 25772]